MGRRFLPRDRGGSGNPRKWAKNGEKGFRVPVELLRRHAGYLGNSESLFGPLFGMHTSDDAGADGTRRQHATKWDRQKWTKNGVENPKIDPQLRDRKTLDPRQVPAKNCLEG